MTSVDLNEPVGSYVARHPQTSRVFEAHQIDYCCCGDKPLEQACRDRELDPQQIAGQLEQAIADDETPSEDWLQAPLIDLCDHIEQTHHAYLRTELPRLTQMIGKVVNAHGESHPKLHELQRVFAALCAELEPHMFKEERILFPAIRRMEQSTATPSFPFGTVANPINMMEHEHDNAGAALSQLRRLTSDYQPPTDACNTYRAMVDGLRELELNMHQHVHKENNILFPRAIELERALAG